MNPGSDNPGSSTKGKMVLEIGLALGVPHADPADRFLAATAKVLDLTLVTADENLLNLSEIVTLPNR
jgi:PIN domain nuclease of toxin-antitoxin system